MKGFCTQLHSSCTFSIFWEICATHKNSITIEEFQLKASYYVCAEALWCRYFIFKIPLYICCWSVMYCNWNNEREWERGRMSNILLTMRESSFFSPTLINGKYQQLRRRMYYKYIHDLILHTWNCVDVFY